LKPASLKIANLSLLLITALPLFSFFIFQHQQKTIQHRMKEKLEQSHLVTVAIHKKDIHWIKENKEIWLNNKMFDIKSSRIENGNYIFTGLYDDDETVLAKQFQKNKQQENNSGNKLVVQLFQLLMAPCDNLQSENAFYISKTNSLIPGLAPSLSEQYISISTPPPQI
jgi:hypothetical protein